MYRVNIVSIKIPANLFENTKNSKIHMEIQGTQTPNILKNDKIGGLQSWSTSWFHELLQSYSNQDNVELA